MELISKQDEAAVFCLGDPHGKSDFLMLRFYELANPPEIHMHGMGRVEKIVVSFLVVVVLSILGVAVYGAVVSSSAPSLHPSGIHNLSYGSLGWVPATAVFAIKGKTYLDPNASYIPLEEKEGYVLVERTPLKGFAVHLAEDGAEEAPPEDMRFRLSAHPVFARKFIPITY